MKQFVRLLLVAITFISAISTQAQSLKPLIESDIVRRIDTLVSFNKDPSHQHLPVTIINGAAKGPVFTIVAGIHGYEYPPIMAVQELMREIDPAKLKGTLLIIPLANVASFYGRAPFVNPIDGKNLNNAFPGSPDGSITQMIADWITREVTPVSKVFLDIHGGDASEDLLPFVCYYNNSKDSMHTAAARSLSLAAGMRYVVSYPYTITSTEPAKYAFKQAVQHGITALSIEAGKLGTVQPDNVQLIKRAVYRMLAHEGLYGKATTTKPAKAVLLNNQAYIKVPQSGIFYSANKAGDQVQQGQQVGYITDLFGKTLATITAPVSGTILYKVGTPPVNAGETLFCIGYQQ